MPPADAEQLIWRAAAAAGSQRTQAGAPPLGPMPLGRFKPPQRHTKHSLLSATLTAFVLVVGIVLGGQTLSGYGAVEGRSAMFDTPLAPGVTSRVELSLENPSLVPADLRLAPTAGEGSLCATYPEPGDLTLDLGRGPIGVCSLASAAAGERGRGPLVAKGVPADGRARLTIALTLARTAPARSVPAAQDVVVARWVDPTSGEVLATEEIELRSRVALSTGVRAGL